MTAETKTPRCTAWLDGFHCEKKSGHDGPHTAPPCQSWTGSLRDFMLGRSRKDRPEDGGR